MFLKGIALQTTKRGFQKQVIYNLKRSAIQKIYTYFLIGLRLATEGRRQDKR